MSTSSFALRPKTRRHIDGFSSPIRFLLITALIARMTMPLPAAASGLAGQHRLKTSPGTRAAAVQSYVEEASRRFLIPDAWIWAVMQVESAGDVRALSSKGAIGLMQIMPKTWTALRSRHRLGPDPYDPRDNILAGAAYLRELHDRYGEHGLLAAYNAGPAVMRTISMVSDRCRPRRRITSRRLVGRSVVKRLPTPLSLRMKAPTAAR